MRETAGLPHAGSAGFSTRPEAHGRPGGDYLVRAVAGEGRVRALACRTTVLVEDARRRHDTWPTATAALGRVLTATAMLAALLKDRGDVTVRLAGSGPLGAVVATGTPEGDVRGYVRHPHVHLPLRPDGKLDVGGAVGLPGLLSVTRDLGVGLPYTGSVPLVSGEIGEDFTAFLAKSEQVPSVVGLGVLVHPDGRVRAAGGFLLQLLPGYPEHWARRLEGHLEGLQGVSGLIDRGVSPEEILGRVLDGLSPRVVGRQPLRFRCRCSRERVRRALAGLGAHQLASMVGDGGGAEVRCHFCGTHYRLSEPELRRLWEEAQDPGAHPEGS